MSFGQVFYVYWSTLCRLVNFMSFGQVLYVVWSTLCRLVKFYMSTGQLNVVWSSFICILVNFHIRSRKADLPFAIRARKRELRLQRYVSRITLTENFRSQNFSKLFLKTFVHVSCYPDHYEPKIFFSVFKVHTYPSSSIHDFGLEGSPCNAISEGRPPLRNTSSEAGAPPSEVRIENDSDRKSSKSKFFKVFLETTFVHVSCYPDHYEPKIRKLGPQI